MLYPGQSLTIQASVLSAYKTTIKSTSLTIVVPPIASGKVYCGPCQFETRSICSNLDGICWDDFEEVNGKVAVTDPDCLTSLAESCFEIWKKQGISSRQCEDFVKLFDLDKMSIRPEIKSAYYLNDGSNIVVNFSQPIRRASFNDCSEYFEDPTLFYLPESYPGQWIAPNILLVEYVPDGDVMTDLLISPDSFYYDYKYAQAPVENGTVPVCQPI